VIEAVAQAAGRPVSRETFDKLREFTRLLEDESARQNLISVATLGALWERHIIDSAQLVRFEPQRGSTWIDIGSGAGLPGVVIACLVEGPVTLAEPRSLRARFLEQTVKTLGLRATIIQSKAERINGSYEVITGRAVASMTRFLTMCDHLSTGKTCWVLPKGRSAQSELEEARRSWQGVFHVEQSVTDPDAKIVVGTGVRALKR
jgi:16S rRNA (guanine527-N7)-methyltransferase